MKTFTVCALRSDKKKKHNGYEVLGECIKVKEEYAAFCPYDFLIVIYEQNCVGLTDEQMRILMYHELLHIGERNGEPRIVPHDIEDFTKIIEEHGLRWSSV